MRRTFGIGVVLLVVLGGIAIGLGAYHAGVNHGLSEAASSRVVHVVDSGEGGGFGFLFFPLFFIGLFLLLRGAAWRRGWRGGPPASATRACGRSPRSWGGWCGRCTAGGCRTAT